VGEGILEWPAILKSVKAHGYDGWLSLEYERRWHPDDIPDASIGMKKSIDYLKSILF
jgi:sugar phosphate isomerase/epimerase